MSNELTTQSEKEINTVLKNSLYPNASDESIGMIRAYCKAAGLDVMLKPVHAVPVWDAKTKGMRDIIMPGIGLYRVIASRSGKYAGMSEPQFGDDITERLGGVEITYPKWCKITVSKILDNGNISQFTAVEYWKENYAIKGGADKSIAPNAMWFKRPYGQLSKCAEAQALRKAFPEVGAQATADEMEGKEIEINPVQYTEQPKETKQKKFLTDEEFTQKSGPWFKLVRDGIKTADEVIATLSAAPYVLTEEQNGIIKGWNREEPEAIEGELV